MITPHDIIAFWRAAGPAKWFAKDAAFDAEIIGRFAQIHHDAHQGALDDWRTSDDGLLALILVLDQFSRNMFRDDARAFASDDRARALANDAIARGVDRRIDEMLRPFIYMPLMHSENMQDQDRCVALFEALGIQENLHFARLHADIIRRFGRFPHRNKTLNRISSAEEQAFLDAGGFAG